MDWIMSHLQLIVFVGGAIAYWLNQRRKVKEAAEIEQSLSVPQPKTQIDDDAERTRRIQEEIRRKILERTSGSTKPVAAPPPMPAAPMAQPTVNSQTGPSKEEEAIAADLAMLERQQMLAAKLQELQAQRREHDRPAEVFAEKTALAMSASGTALRGSVLADLRNPVSVRRAIVLREVLGTPVGLR